MDIYVEVMPPHPALLCWTAVSAVCSVCCVHLVLVGGDEMQQPLAVLVTD